MKNIIDGFFIALVTGFVFLLGVLIRDEYRKADLVERGLAEYYIDENNNKSFRIFTIEEIAEEYIGGIQAAE